MLGMSGIGLGRQKKNKDEKTLANIHFLEEHSARGSFWLDVKKDRQLYFLLAPALVMLFIFHYIPIYGIVIAFQDYNAMDGVFGSTFIGLKHFARFFDNPYFPRLIRNTFLINFYGMIFGFPAPIILALLLNEVPHLRYKRIVQSISYLPHFISTVVVVGILWRIFSANGIANSILGVVGLKPINFLVKNGWFRPLYIGSGIWTGVGWGSILYLAALSGVNEEIYEASIIDGTNRLQRIIHVNIPVLIPTVTLLLIMNMSSMLRVGFEKVFLMQNPAIYEVADVIATYVYREGIASGNFSYGAAVGFFDSVVAVVLIFIANTIARRVSETSLW